MKIEEKTIIIKELAEKMSPSAGIWVTEYKGINALTMAKLRRTLYENNLNYKVVKNTIMEYVLKDLGVETPEGWLQGMVGVCFGENIPVGSQVLTRCQGLKLKGAYLEGVFYGPEKVREIANIPSREVLLSQLLSVMNAPLSRFMSVLNAPMREAVCTLNEIAKKKGVENG